MEIAGEPSSEIELVQRVSAQCESFDTKNYVSTEDDNDANNLTHETRNNKAMDSVNLDYDDVIESKQTQRPICTNTAQYRNIGNPHCVSMEDYNDVNNITQQTRTIAAINITNLDHSDINQSDQTQEPYTSNFNHECQVENCPYEVPVDNTNLNQQPSPKVTSVSRQTLSYI